MMCQLVRDISTCSPVVHTCLQAPRLEVEKHPPIITRPGSPGDQGGHWSSPWGDAGPHRVARARGDHTMTELTGRVNQRGQPLTLGYVVTGVGLWRR
jgi:hypothetical protein